MTIPFASIPDNLRTPLFFVELDNSMANTATATQRTLLIGLMLPGAGQQPNVPVLVSSAQTVANLCGSGSQLHLMMQAYIKNDIAGNVYILPLADPGELDSSSGPADMIAASGAINVTASSTAAGIISLYIGGVRVQVAIRPTNPPEDIAGFLAQAINKMTSLPVTAIQSAGTGSIAIQAKNAGEAGNSIRLQMNLLGTPGGEATPAGLGIQLTSLSGGAGAPALDDALASLGDKAYDFIVCPYTDTTSLNSLKDFLSDSDGRWNWSQQLYGHVFTYASGTYGELTAKGELRNNQHESLPGMYNSPTPDFVWAAAIAGAAAPSLRNSPMRPLQTLAVSGVMAPPEPDRFMLVERNNLLHSGISTLTVDDDGTVRIENLITTYQTNNYGAEDDSYLQIETLFLLMYNNRWLKTQVTSKFARMSLVKDGTRFATGSAIVTPSTIKAELIADYKTLEYAGYAQDSEGFAKGLIVEQNSKNPNRVDVLWDGVLPNQLRIFAVLNQFRLQSAVTA
ncbi:phage tail sheath subtilisin-like domain-containing protein [Trabulsiella odontotermitis]|uniref:Tail protein n=1 Tax=Trabulsiella odontotermitis TaxID=379893 RepID=A0A0L0GZ19_9ENTR|nr:phage tail sheath subtilisin-like domain-containing protein [Trabulsiella odontotermitis]KNC94162.1 tail protein [Trabulsiella odontotermitis]